ncbi:MAG: hypothetical protein M8364_05815 [Methylobacter sp.]|jgi:hypothetical protein|uniref:hypothetical protein n=1 Tax=Methylobacter TaxID=429 RepID=UPI000482B536|nr:MULTISPECIES: hypothetical protein [Methylobacter]MCL7420402.1 hypothetical protein [Methylobacter sp.]
MKKHPVLVLMLGLIALILIQREVIMPLVNKVIQSDLFLVDSEDQGSVSPVSTPLTGLAFTHCNNYIKSELGSEVSINFPEKPLNAWSLGDYQYVVNAEIDITRNASNTVTKKYVCRINYKNKSDEEGAFDFSNWTIYGLSGLDDI